MVKLLEKIETPADLKRVDRMRLPILATEIRELIPETVLKTKNSISPVFWKHF